MVFGVSLVRTGFVNLQVTNKKPLPPDGAGRAVTTSLCVEAAYSDRRSGKVGNCFLARLLRGNMMGEWRLVTGDWLLEILRSNLQ